MLKLTTLKSLQPNETVQDGCDSHVCKVNEKQEFIWERRITGCPPFDSRRCLAEGVSSEMGPICAFLSNLCLIYGSVHKYHMCSRVEKPQIPCDASAKQNMYFLLVSENQLIFFVI